MPEGNLTRLPFAYEASVILPPRRKTETVILRDLVDVVLPSVADEGAPVALVLHRGDIARRWGELGKALEQAPIERYRTFGDRLYRPLAEGVTATDFEADALDAKAWFRGWKAPGSRSPSWMASSYPLTIRNPRSFSDVAPMGLDTWQELKAESPKARLVASDREVRMAEAAERLARDLLIVEGEVWVGLKGEPHWVVHPDVNSSTVGIALQFSRRDPLPYLFPFSMREGREAKAFASVLSALKGWPLSAEEVTAEVLVAEALHENSMVLGAAQMLSCLPYGTSSGDWSAAAEATIGQLRELARSRELDADGAAVALAALARLEEADELAAAFGPRDGHRAFGWLAYERWLGERERHPGLDIRPDLDEDDAAALSLG